MPLELIQELQKISSKKLDLKINNNRSTMLSVRWGGDCTRVSLHHIFLEAPPHVMKDVATYISGKKKIIAPSVKAFIEEKLSKMDCSNLLDLKKLSHEGEFYNLQEIYDRVNKYYFHNELKLHITWFGRHGQKNRSRVTFGLFYQHLKLIKIHRLLDSTLFPPFVIDYVVYHEMLHHLYPAYVDEKGIHHIHSKEFKQREAKFENFDLVRKWIREHERTFFLD